MFHTVMEAAKRKEEKQLALDILTRVPNAATLDLAVSHLDDAELTGAAADAAVKIAAKLVAKQPKTVAEAMQKVVAAKVHSPAGNRAKLLLEQSQGAAK